MTRRPFLLLLVFPLGWLYDILFWGGPANSSLPIFITVCLLFGLIVLLGNDLRPARGSRWFIPLATFFAFMTLFPAKSLTYKFALIFTFFSLYLLCVSYLGGRWMDYSLFDYFTRFFQLAGSIIARPLMFLGQLRREQAERGQIPGSAPSGEFSRGLIIAIPVVLGFSCLLSLADLAFQDVLKRLPSIIQDNLSWMLKHLPGILVMSDVLAGIFLHAGTQSADVDQPARPPSEPFLGFAGAAAVLVGVLSLFFCYATFQIPFLSVTAPKDNPDGYPFALVGIILLCLLLIYWLRTVTVREDGWRRWAYSTLNAYIFLVMTVILFTLNQRLPALMAKSTEPDHLLLARGSLVWLSLIYLIFVILEAARRERDFAFTVVWVTILLAFLFFAYRAGTVIGKLFAPYQTGELLRLMGVMLKG